MKEYSIKQYNLYQSNIWNKIQTDIYGKEAFSISFNKKEYQVIIKEKKIKGFSFKWFQIMGIELKDFLKISILSNNSNKLNELKNELNSIKAFIKEKYNSFFGLGNIFIQLCFIDDITVLYDLYNKTLNNNSLNDNLLNNNSKEFKKYIKNIEDKIALKLGLKVSFKNNMPLKNIIYNLDNFKNKYFIKNKNLTLNYKNIGFNTNAKRIIGKAIKNNIIFRELKEKELENFWKEWKKVSILKGFNTISKKQYIKLYHYLKDKKQGKFFVTTDNDNNIISGGIFLFDYNINHTNYNVITYLYGFSVRDKKNSGGQQYLLYKTMEWGIQNNFSLIDTMGGASIREKDSSLFGVTRLKESLGGYSYEVLGNYDIVLNNILYFLFKYKSKK